MKIHRFIGDFALSDEEIHLADQKLIKQFKEVLRLAPGSLVALVDLSGREVLATIIEFKRQEIILKRQQIIEVADNFKQISLYCCLLKKENFELVVQKATESGVTQIVPVISERTIKTGLKYDRLLKIITEASEQSGRRLKPKLLEPVTFSQALALAQTNERNLFFDPHGQKWQGADFTATSIGLFVGPEGGWTETERTLALKSGCQLRSLGELILRGETAAIVATYLAAQVSL